MATSDINLIPYVLNNVCQVEMNSLLDVGMGFGKYGALIRDYCDLIKSEDPEGWKRENWRMKIDGIDGFAEFIGERQRANYDEIHIGDCREILPTLGNYDGIIMIAALIHMSKEDGLQLIRDMYEHCNKFVLFTAPPYLIPQDDDFGNPFEIHHPVIWKPEDLSEFPTVIHGYAFAKQTQIFILPKPDVPMKFIDRFRKPPLTRRIKNLVQPVIGNRVASLIGRVIHGHNG